VGSFTAGTYGRHEGAKKVASISTGTPGAKGAIRALKARDDWEVTTNPNAPLCSLQWAPHRAVRWERVMEESPATKLVASHHYARAGLLRRVELFSALVSAGAIGSMPATLTLTRKGIVAAGEDAASALETAAGGACRWRLKQGGSAVICSSAAEAVKLISGGDEQRWSVIQQIEGDVMELSATVLLAGNIRIGLHRDISVSMNLWPALMRTEYVERLQMPFTSPSSPRRKVAGVSCHFPTALKSSPLLCLRFAMMGSGSAGYSGSRTRSLKIMVVMIATLSPRMRLRRRCSSFSGRERNGRRLFLADDAARLLAIGKIFFCFSPAKKKSTTFRKVRASQTLDS
jgi:hypothetical protein